MQRLWFTDHDVDDDLAYNHVHQLLCSLPPCLGPNAGTGIFAAWCVVVGIVVGSVLFADLALNPPNVWMMRFEDLAPLSLVIYSFVSAFSTLKNPRTAPPSVTAPRAPLDSAVWGLRTLAPTLNLTSLVFYAAQHEILPQSLHMGLVGAAFAFSFLSFMFSSGAFLLKHALCAMTVTTVYCVLLCVFDKVVERATYKAVPWGEDNLAAVRGSVLLIAGSGLSHVVWWCVHSAVKRSSSARISFAPPQRYAVPSQP